MTRPVLLSTDLQAHTSITSSIVPSGAPAFHPAQDLAAGQKKAATPRLHQVTR